MKKILTIISEQPYEETIRTMKKAYHTLDVSGNIFIIFRTEYDHNGCVLHDFLDIIHYGLQLGFQYINTIVYPSDLKTISSFIDNIKYIVWFVKDRNLMLFNKDLIREKHIWKDIEWGKREKNYNPKGKDPGNVWIPTNDNGRGKIVEHIQLSDTDVINKLISMSLCGNNYEVLTNNIKQINHLNNKTMILYESVNHIHIKSKINHSIIYFLTSENMEKVDNNSIQTIITSPPYWNLKDYFKDGQIGQESYNQYLKRLYKVFFECYKKLNDMGSLWININIRMYKKQVILIPYDIILICKQLGYFYKGIFIWHKSSGIPVPNNNVVDRHEYVLFFSKTKDFSLNMDIQQTFIDYQNSDINGGAIWNINRKAGSIGKKMIHPAIYPNELVKRILLMTTNEGDIVLDPFLGSGTTLIESIKNQRLCIGFEYNEDFEMLIDSRIHNELNIINKDIILKCYN